MATTSRDGIYPMPPVIEPRTRVGRRWRDAPLRRKLLTLVATIAGAAAPNDAVPGFTPFERLDAGDTDIEGSGAPGDARAEPTSGGAGLSPVDAR